MKGRACLSLALLLVGTGHAASAGTDEPTSGGLHLSIGPGIYSMPRYPGAQGSHTRFFPFIDAEYDNRYYTSVADLFGVYAFKTDTAQAGAAFEIDPTERGTHHEARLHGLKTVRDTTRFKLFASRTILFVTADGNVATDMLGHGQGTLAQANLWFTAPVGRDLSINVGPGATWADARYMSSFFGVTPREAADSFSLAAYPTHAGILDTHLNALVEWQLFSHYRIGILGYLANLNGIAAASPIVQERRQRTVVGWVGYRFQ